MGSKVTDRSVLSDELAIFCQYPIYNVRKLEDSMTATRIQTSRELHVITAYGDSVIFLVGMCR